MYRVKYRVKYQVMYEVNKQVLAASSRSGRRVVRRLVGLCCGVWWLLGALPVQAVEVGDPMPDFALRDLLDESQVVHGAGFAEGKWLYVDFWASWCGPCRVSLPALSALHDAYRARGFEVLAINVDTKPEAGRRFLAKTPVSYRSLSDPEGAVAESFAVPGMPTSYLINPEGRIAWVHVGFRRGDAERVRSKLDAMLPGAAAP